LFLALLLAACSDTFDPFVESDRAFALYGFLDARRDTQFVRAQPIVAGTAVDPGAIRVTSTDLETQETTVWQDSLVRLDDGTLGTAFFAIFRPQPGQPYRVEAARTDVPGVTVEAVMALPSRAPLQTAEPVEVGDAITQRLTFEGALPITEVTVRYTVRRVEEGSKPRAFDIRYSPPTTGERDVLVSLGRNAETIRAALGAGPNSPERVDIALLDLRVSYDIVAERQAEVMGGIGNFGVAASFSDGWTLAPAFVEAIGFVDAQDDGGAE
jgi:hypothetical protein